MSRFRGTPRPDDAQFGTDFKDVFIGAFSDDVFFGDGGDDRIEGKRGDDWLQGGDGVDLIYGGKGDDFLYGEGGYGNHLEGSTGNDRLYSGMVNGNWSELIGGRGADRFSVGFDDYNSIESGLHAWTDIRDFREGDELELGLNLASGAQFDSADTLAAFDSDLDGRLTDADDAVMWDGRALQVSSATSTLVLWGLDHIDTSMLIG